MFPFLGADPEVVVLCQNPHTKKIHLDEFRHLANNHRHTICRISRTVTMVDLKYLKKKTKVHSSIRVTHSEKWINIK